MIKLTCFEKECCFGKTQRIMKENKTLGSKLVKPFAYLYFLCKVQETLNVICQFIALKYYNYQEKKKNHLPMYYKSNKSVWVLNLIFKRILTNFLCQKLGYASLENISYLKYFYCLTIVKVITSRCKQLIRTLKLSYNRQYN